jgi:hypothetical protein
MKTRRNIVFLSLILTFIVAGCGQKTDKTENQQKEEQKGKVAEPKAENPGSELGNFAGLIGNWTVDAETAGLRMDISFTEDGKFHQKMGESHEQSGTWEVVDDQHVKIVTPSTKGQTWLVTELTDEGVNICWNPESDDPKTIPFQKAE